MVSFCSETTSCLLRGTLDIRALQVIADDLPLLCSISVVEVTEGLVLQFFRSSEVRGLKDSIVFLNKPLVGIQDP